MRPLIVFLSCWWVIFSWMPAEAKTEKIPPFAGVISGDRVNIRAGGNLNFEILTQLNRDDKVIVLDRSPDWYKIKIPESSAVFISQKYVKRLRGVYQVNADRVNVRAGAGLNYNVIGQLNSGDRITVLEKKGDWYRVRPPVDFAAWVYRDFVKYYSTVEGHLRKEKSKKELKKKFAELNAQAAIELNKPPEEAQLQPLLEEYGHFIELYADYPEAVSAGKKLKELRLKKTEIDRLKAAGQLKQPKEKPEESLTELRRPPDAEPVPAPAAIGKIEDLGMIINRPGTHKLIINGRIAYYLKSSKCNLSKHIYYPVAVWGGVTHQPDWKYPLISVEKVEVITR